MTEKRDADIYDRKMKLKLSHSRLAGWRAGRYDARHDSRSALQQRLRPPRRCDRARPTWPDRTYYPLTGRPEIRVRM